jgi:hypothetical protein
MDDGRLQARDPAAQNASTNHLHSAPVRLKMELDASAGCEAAFAFEKESSARNVNDVEERAWPHASRE